MGCFESKPDDKREPTQVRGCTDVCWLCIYIVFWLLMVNIFTFSIEFFLIRNTSISETIRHQLRLEYNYLRQFLQFNYSLLLPYSLSSMEIHLKS